MSRNAAVVSLPGRIPAPIGPERPNFGEMLGRIERACVFLDDKRLSILSFSGSTLDSPVVLVAAAPRVYALFSGRCERRGYCQDGALRYETWEAFDIINQVRVRWQEVVACGS